MKTIPHDRHGRLARWRRRMRAIGALGILVGFFAACSAPTAPAKPEISTTKVFDALYGGLPPIPVEAPAYAAVVYLPAAGQPGRLLTAPIFTAETDKVAFLAARAAVRGIDQQEFARRVALPFPRGTDLGEFRLEQGKAIFHLGGALRAASMAKEDKLRAAESLALTAKQFGDVGKVEITDADGGTIFNGPPPAAEVSNPGIPRALGLLAVREEKGHPATVLSVLFDRPVFVEEIAFYPPREDSPYAGKGYSAGFGMSVEFHPDQGTTFETHDAYRVRYKLRDGKGRTAEDEIRQAPKDVIRE